MPPGRSCCHSGLAHRRSANEAVTVRQTGSTKAEYLSMSLRKRYKEVQRAGDKRFMPAAFQRDEKILLGRWDHNVNRANKLASAQIVMSKEIRNESDAFTGKRAMKRHRQMVEIGIASRIRFQPCSVPPPLPFSAAIFVQEAVLEQIARMTHRQLVQLRRRADRSKPQFR
jgi:Ribonuclease G/E